MSDKQDSKNHPQCPLCEKPMAAEFKPFCSKRCKDVDLNRWLSGSYAIPSNEIGTPEDEEF